MTGGLAAALASGGRKFWRDLGRFVRPRARRTSEGTVCRNRGVGRRCAGDARSAGGALRRLLRRLRQFRAVAGAAFAQRPDPRHAGRLSQLPRGQRLHGARAASLQQAGHRVLGAGLSLPRARRGAARARRHLSRSASSCTRRGPRTHHRGRAASSRTDRGDAGLRSHRLPDRRGPRQLPRLCQRKIWICAIRRRRRDLAGTAAPARRCSRSASMPRSLRSRPRSRSRIPTCRGCAAASTASGSRSASTGSIIPRASSIASMRSTGCGRSIRI